MRHPPVRPGNLFLAWPVRASELDALAATLPEGVRRLAPADRHATAVFLGRVPTEIGRRALDLARRSPPPRRRAVLDAAACMGNPRRPTALAVEATGDVEELARWRDALLEALAAVVEPLDRRPLRLHVTLGRPPRRAPDRLVRACRRWCRTVAFPPIEVVLDRLVLYGPADPASGLRYRSLGEVVARP